MPLAPARAVTLIRSRFRALGTPERAAGAKAYMKSALTFYGVTSADVRFVAKELCDAHRAISRAELVAIVDALFATDNFDLRSAGVALLERKVALLEARDAKWLVELARKGACWAHVDYVTTKVVDPLVAKNPELLRAARVWAKDEDFWVRRVALLSQLAPLRRGGGDFALFAAIAAPMLGEKEFFLRKAIGWVLREVSKKRPELVLAFFREHGAEASPLTWREGTKYLPPAMKRQLGLAERAATSS